MTRHKITEGVYTLNTEGVYAKYARHAVPGTFPRRYWDIEFTEDDEEDLTHYLSGQEPFIKEPEPERYHECARCGRACRVRFNYCYRCYNYLKTRERIRRSA